MANGSTVEAVNSRARTRRRAEAEAVAPQVLEMREHLVIDGFHPSRRLIDVDIFALLRFQAIGIAQIGVE